MIFTLKKASLVVVALLLAVSASHANGKKTKILGVGNSFTQNSMKYLPQIIQADKSVDADVAMAYIGGSPLDLHVRLFEKYEKDPQEGNKYTYKYNNKTLARKVSLKKILTSDKWDYITIQQVSSKSYKPKTFSPYGKKLYDYIKKYAPQATIVIHETWPHRIDCPRTKKWNLQPKAMYKKLHANYMNLAKELNVGIIPAGTAIVMAYDSPEWNFKPLNPKPTIETCKETEENKALLAKNTNSGFHSGYRWRTNKKTGKKYIGLDGFHLNHNGEYLAGLVWYDFFFNKDPRALSYRPKFLTAKQDKSLKELAHKAVESMKDYALKK